MIIFTKWLRWSGGRGGVIFSKVKHLAFVAFLKINSTTDIYSESYKTFWATFSRIHFCFNISQGITVFTNRFFLLFCETILITRKSVFRRNFQWSVGPKHLALTVWKRYCTIVRIASACYVQAEDCNACLHETLSTW